MKMEASMDNRQRHRMRQVLLLFGAAAALGLLLLAGQPVAEPGDPVSVFPHHRAQMPRLRDDPRRGGAGLRGPARRAGIQSHVPSRSGTAPDALHHPGGAVYQIRRLFSAALGTRALSGRGCGSAVLDGRAEHMAHIAKRRRAAFGINL